MKKIVLCIFILALLFSCIENKEEPKDNAVIPVAEAVGTGEILNLSDYAKSVVYIPLETNDSVLISEIDQVAYEDHKIIILTNEECLILDEKGRHQCRLGHKGMGPNEFAAISSFDILPNKQQIFLRAYPRKYFLYSFDGKLIDRIQYAEFIDDCITIETMNLYSNYYFSDVVSYRHIHYKGFLFEAQDTISTIVKSYPNYVDSEKENKNTFSLAHEKAHLYRYKDEICFHKNINDTVFSIDSTFELKKRFVFDFGKYRASKSWLLEMKLNKELKYIWPLNIQESERFLFLNFFFGNYAPEKFEYIKQFGSSRTPKLVINYNVHGLFDKQTGYLHLLNQPIKKQLGFRNDIDGGPTFWPKYISLDNKMVTYWNAEEFLKLYEQLENPSPELKKIAEKLTPDDNPVLMIVTLK